LTGVYGNLEEKKWEKPCAVVDIGPRVERHKKIKEQNAKSKN
jgi:hypothetical protein